MNWATRAGVHIDRAACAWLIRRFIDPHARFVFVTDPAQLPAGATGFDMAGVDLSHHTRPDGTEECSFETMLRRYHLDDPLLWRLAQAVHEADLDDERCGRSARSSPRSPPRPAPRSRCCSSPPAC